MSHPLKPSSFSAFPNGYGFSWLMFVFQLLSSKCAAAAFILRSCTGGPLGAQSASGCDPPALPPVSLMPPKGGRSPSPRVGGRQELARSCTAGITQCRPGAGWPRPKWKLFSIICPTFFTQNILLVSLGSNFILAHLSRCKELIF